jgi:hypothetical protein
MALSSNNDVQWIKLLTCSVLLPHNQRSQQRLAQLLVAQLLVAQLHSLPSTLVDQELHLHMQVGLFQPHLYTASSNRIAE